MSRSIDSSCSKNRSRCVVWCGVSCSEMQCFFAPKKAIDSFVDSTWRVKEEEGGTERQSYRGRERQSNPQRPVLLYVYIAFHATHSGSLNSFAYIVRLRARALIPHPSALLPCTLLPRTPLLYATLCHAKSFVFVPFELENFNFNYNFCFSLERSFIVPPPPSPGLTGRRRWMDSTLPHERTL